MIRIILYTFIYITIANCNSSRDYKVENNSFDWRLNKIDSNSSFEAKVIDVDAFMISKESITKWKKDGKTIIAYLSVGSFESYRDDAKDFPTSILGNPYPNYPKERFLNIREIELLKPIITKRFDLIKDKGFDGVEPDNMDIYTRDLNDKNGTGFSLTVEDTKRYIDFLIEEAHKRGLTIGQKNGVALVAEYASKFDWALTEDAFYHGFADKFKPYVDLNKAVFSTEYTDNISEEEFIKDVCPEAKRLGFIAILKNRELDDYILNCP